MFIFLGKLCTLNLHKYVHSSWVYKIIYIIYCTLNLHKYVHSSWVYKIIYIL